MPRQNSTNACDQLTGADRLGQTVVRSECQAAGLDVFRYGAGEHQDGDVAALAQLLEQVQSTPPTEIHVQDRELRSLAVEQLDCCWKAARHRWTESSSPQQERESLEEVVVVVDQKDPAAGRGTVRVSGPQHNWHEGIRCEHRSIREAMRGIGPDVDSPTIPCQFVTRLMTAALRRSAGHVYRDWKGVSGRPGSCLAIGTEPCFVAAPSRPASP